MMERRSLHEHWRLFLVEGIILLVLGVAAMLLPLFAGLAATILLGWLLLVAGCAGLLFTFRTRGLPGGRWSWLSAALALAAGLLLLWNPLRGLATLTWGLVAYFFVDGIFMILFGIAHRRESSRRWEWLLFNGVIDVILAGVIVSWMPGSLSWALGLIVGIDMVFGGASLLALALAARRPVFA